MPRWFVDIASLEAAGIILVVTGCFVAGVISGFVEVAEAEKANRRRFSMMTCLSVKSRIGFQGTCGSFSGRNLVKQTAEEVSLMDQPGARAERMLAYGLELGPPCKEAVERHGPMMKANGFWNRLTRMPRWERVELLLGLYECAHWKVELPQGDRVERALWYVAREMNCFHRNVLERE